MYQLGLALSRPTVPLESYMNFTAIRRHRGFQNVSPVLSEHSLKHDSSTAFRLQPIALACLLAFNAPVLYAADCPVTIDTGTPSCLPVASPGTVHLDPNVVLGNGAMTLDEGKLLATGSMSLSNALTLSNNTTIAAAAGATLILDGAFNMLDGSNMVFGDATNTGTVRLATPGGAYGHPITITVVGGTLQAANNELNALVSRSIATTVNQGATMDFDGQAGYIVKLFGAGVVKTDNNTIYLGGGSDFSGQLMGSAQIQLLGGVANLSGDNSYTGPTIISGGSVLEIGQGGATGTLGSGDVSNSGTLAFNRNNQITVANTITGSGMLQQNGSGNLLLTGNSTYSGGTEVNSGRLSVNGSVLGMTTVNAGGTLGGAGVIEDATIQSGGTLAPGNSIGTLTLTGNLVFNPGSFFDVEVDHLGAADQIKVLAPGTVTINGGTLNVLASAGTYAAATHYTIIDAPAGISGNFSAITSNLAFLTPTVSNTGTTLDLLLTRNTVDFSAIARTDNQRGASLALAGLGAGAINTAVVALDAATARSAFSQLAGELHASAQAALVDDTDFVRSAVTQRLYQPDGQAVWFKASSVHGYADGNSNSASTSRHMNGGLLGSDRSIGEGAWTAGILGGYSDTSFSSQRSSADIKTVHLGAYAGRSFDHIQLKLGTGYAYNRLDTNRSLSFGAFNGREKADYDAHCLQAFADVGYRFQNADGSVEPFFNLSQVHTAREGFSERGGEGALQLRDEQSNVTLSTIGLRLDQALTASHIIPLRLQGSIGYRHAAGDVTPEAEANLRGSASFEVKGSAIAREAAICDIGLYSQLTPALSAGLNYRGQHGDDVRIHAANLHLTWMF